MDQIGIDTSQWPIVVVTPPSQVTNEQMAAFYESFYAMLQRRAEPYVGVMDARKIQGMSPVQRKMQTDYMQRNAEFSRRYCRGYALVFDSVVMRGVLTAILWVRKPEHETAVFGTVHEAMAWARVQISRHATAPKASRG